MCSTDGRHTEGAKIGDSVRGTERLDRTYEALKRREANECGMQANTSIQYTPAFITFVLGLYVNPAQREYHLRKDDAHVLLSEAAHRREMIDLLERAGIVRNEVRTDRDFPYVVLAVDEEALRVYVNALCRVSLPTKVWVMR